ncbi:MAG: sugar phosphate isomerase/epimerase [Chitinophagaceae bacterium]|nr:sugar phosphate isomerase/epimerase [Chitinophagaceae bacterium]
MNRKSFIQNSALAIAAISIPDFTFAKPKYPKNLVGLQLYSVRNAMKANPLDTLKKLSAMGFHFVEHANYLDRKFYGYNAKEFVKILKDLGLKMPSGHTVFETKHWDYATKDFTAEWKYTIEDAATCGQQFVISPSLESAQRKTVDDLKSFMEIFNKNGELCKKYGMKFGYHNHDFEFSQKLGTQTVFELILDNTDPNLVMQQLDMGNLYNGGANALDIVKKYPGRFESWHVKDEILSENKREKYESTILGKGIVPVKEILAIAVQSKGTGHLIIEQESYQGIDPLESMKINLSILKSWGHQ